jgi:7-carboxy-7-deazaguanine synthase
VRIAEIFDSIQGEGLYTGERSLFVRTTGCNLRCWFCDTPYTSRTPEGFLLPWQDVLTNVRSTGVRHVVLTGGEPLLQPEIVPLSQALQDIGHIVTVETAGTVYRPVAADLMSISPKLANSSPDESVPRWRARHQRDQYRPEVLRRLMTEYPYQLKFVIDTASDLDDVQRYLEALGHIPGDRVWLMPQGVTQESLAAKAEWLKPAADRLGYHFCPRRHIEMFGNIRGT